MQLGGIAGRSVVPPPEPPATPDKVDSAAVDAGKVHHRDFVRPRRSRMHRRTDDAPTPRSAAPTANRPRPVPSTPRTDGVFRPYDRAVAFAAWSTTSVRPSRRA